MECSFAEHCIPCYCYSPYTFIWLKYTAFPFYMTEHQSYTVGANAYYRNSLHSHKSHPGYRIIWHITSVCHPL